MSAKLTVAQASRAFLMGGFTRNISKLDRIVEVASEKPKRKNNTSSIVKGIRQVVGVWSANYRGVYLGCHLTYEEACLVRLTVQEKCADVNIDLIMPMFLKMVESGELPAPLKQGSANRRKPRGHRFDSESGAAAQKKRGSYA